MTNLPLPEDYAAVLADLKRRVSQARYQAQRQVNTELIRLYWQIGKILAERTDRARWGDRVLTRLSSDLRSEFTGATGLSVRNLKYMRSFARTWSALDETGQQPVAQLPWGHVTVLLDKLGDQEQRDWYAAEAVTHGWSRAVLEHHIKTHAHQRFAAAPANFDRILTADGSDQARHLTKDPYVFDFLRLERDFGERELENDLVEQGTPPTTACRHRRPVAVHRQERPGRSLFARNQQSAHGDRQLRPAGTCRAGRVAVRGRSHSGPRVTVSRVPSSAVESPPT